MVGHVGDVFLVFDDQEDGLEGQLLGVPLDHDVGPDGLDEELEGLLVESLAQEEVFDELGVDDPVFVLELLAHVDHLR